MDFPFLINTRLQKANLRVLTRIRKYVKLYLLYKSQSGRVNEAVSLLLKIWEVLRSLSASRKSRTENFIAKRLPAAETLPLLARNKTYRTVAVLSNFALSAIKHVIRSIPVVTDEEKTRGDFEGPSEYLYRNFDAG